MNVLMVGTGKGSWEIRGEQLGAALGARVTSTPTDIDWVWADVVVLVKRAVAVHGARAKQAGRPVVWDALDFWTQPGQNQVTADEAVRLARLMSADAQPALTIGATQAMADALGGAYLPHHAWPDLTPTPASENASVVAYQGNAAYLGRWEDWIDAACRDRVWTFVINPPDIRDADILVSFRDGPWDGWICREWKSGVKLVNAKALGRPVIGQPSAAWREVQPEGSHVERPDELGAALDAWSDASARAAVASAACALPSYRIEAVAAHYRTLLEGVACPA